MERGVQFIGGGQALSAKSLRVDVNSAIRIADGASANARICGCYTCALFCLKTRRGLSAKFDARAQS
ncbi:MAG: hypothetical protein WBS14_18140, partial [Rhodomicrobium sp.]